MMPRSSRRVDAPNWVAGDGLLEHLAVLYVVESGQPEISRTGGGGERALRLLQEAPPPSTPPCTRHSTSSMPARREI